MKIMHCCLSNFYIDNYNYQENILPRLNILDGHDVLVIASTETYIDNNRLGYIQPSEYFNDDNILVKRLPYRWLPSKYMQRKIRYYKGFEKTVLDFMPDVIMFHGTSSLDIITLKKIKKHNPEITIYLDSHEDFHNSARNFLSKYILHKIFYRNILQSSLPYIDKIFYVTYESLPFLTNLYGLPENLLEYYPLGGIVVDERTRKAKNNDIRKLHGISALDILLVHSGKMERKKRTFELVKALHETGARNMKLLIIGSMTPDVSNDVMPIIKNDNRIIYLGWKNGKELTDYLCACDLYVQPGTQSATMQNALCCGSAAALFPYESHKYLLNDSVFYIETVDDMKKLFIAIAEKRELLEEKRRMSNIIVKEKLDYRILAARLYK